MCDQKNMIWWTVFCYISSLSLAKIAIIQAPEEILTADLKLKWTEDLEGKEATLTFEEEIICENKLNKNDKFQFHCGCFSIEGNYTIRIENEEISFQVLWPEISVISPSKVNTLESDVKVKLKSKLRLCKPLKSGHLRTILQGFRKNEVKFQSSEDYNLVFSMEVNHFWNISEIILPCTFLDRAGLYKFNLLVFDQSNNSIAMLGQSSPMKVSWYDGYELQMRTDSIYPYCGPTIAISFKKPQCPVSNDRIRLYAIARTARNTISKPTKLLYLGEKRLYPDTKSVSFSCSKFDILYIGFCFKLLTASNDGFVRNHATQCVPTERKRNMPQDGAWSEWQSWGDCSATCGKGIRQRKRLCNKPKPVFGGTPCAGRAIEIKECFNEICKKPTTKSFGTLVTAPCQCGCNLTKNGVLVAHSGLCSNSNSSWLIFGYSNSRTKILIKMIRLNLAKMDVFRVRNGLHSTDQLLFDAAFAPNFTGTFRSSTNGVRVEFFSLNQTKFETKSPRTKQLWQGAVMEYYFYDPSTIDLSDRDFHFDPWQYMTKRNLIVVGIIIFTSIIICLIGVGLWWHTKKKMDANFLLISSQSTNASEHSGLCANFGKTNQAVLTSPNDDKTYYRKERNVQVPVERHSYLVEARLPEIPEEMQASTVTQSTRISGISQKSMDSSGYLSAASQPKKRSIGIQLNSPAPSLKRQISFESRNNTPSLSHQAQGKFASELSLAGTEQDFEYDYYEPTFIGSYLTPMGDAWMESQIDIDQIIGNSDLMKTPINRSAEELEKCSVSTQIENNDKSRSSQ